MREIQRRKQVCRRTRRFVVGWHIAPGLTVTLEWNGFHFFARADQKYLNSNNSLFPSIDGLHCKGGISNLVPSRAEGKSQRTSLVSFTSLSDLEYHRSFCEHASSPKFLDCCLLWDY